MSELKLDTPLRIDEIDFRVQSINKGGFATILAYKDARVDIRRLNAVFGILGWQREHSRDNHNCTVSIWDDEKKHWVSKEDTGTESNTEQQKGLASDSFKRACFNWGIGLELYDYPEIKVKLNANEWKMQGDYPKATYDLKLKEWVWYSEFDEDGKLSVLAAKDQKGDRRFTWKAPTDSHRWKKGEKADILSQMGACLLDGDAEGVKEIYSKHTGSIEEEMKFFAIFSAAERTIIKQYLSETKEETT